MEFLTHNIAPIMFGGLIVFLLLGFPVAFSLGACGLFFGFIGIELGLLPEALMQALPLRVFGIMQNETLLAIPFFTLMGLILERSGMAEDLLDTIGQLFGPIRGGLAFAVIFVGALLAATTGVVVGILQAATSINEPTVAFVAKVIALVAVVALTGNFLLGRLVSFTTELFQQIPHLIG